MSLMKTLHGIKPTYGANCWFAETSVLIGQVKMGDRCTVWYHAVVRGDVHTITIGDDTNIQDGATIHCTYQKAATTIGSRVSIGHQAIIHGCTLEDDTLIGMGAIVMDHAVVGSGSIVGAGAVVLAHTIIPPGSVYVGNPAKRVKAIDEKGKAMIARTAHNYPKYARWFQQED